MMSRASSVAVDTNVVVNYLRRVPASVEWFNRLERCRLPLPVYSEIYVGAIGSSDPAAGLRQVNAVVERADILPLGPRSAVEAARLRLALRRKGKPIPVNDIWIAACCIEHDVPLATNDAHFRDLEGLRVVSAT